MATVSRRPPRFFPVSHIPPNLSGSQADEGIKLFSANILTEFGGVDVVIPRITNTGNNWNYYINPAKFREYVGTEAFNTFFGLTA